LLNLALGSSEEAQDNRKLESNSKWRLKRRPALGVALDAAVYTTMGVTVHRPGGGGATALFLPRLAIWEFALAVTGQGTALGVAVPPP
jgi:hypothetical protein